MYTRFILLIGLISLSLIYQSESARILGVFPSPSKSHLIIHTSIADALAEAGHDVTVIGLFPKMNKKAKYKYIHVDAAKLDQAFTQQMIDKPEPVYKKFPAMIKQISKNANNTMQNPKMVEFLQTHKAGDFDVMIMGYFMNDFMLGLGAHFQCPVVISWMIQPVFAINALLANPSEHAYVPSLFGQMEQPMNFMQRVKNYMLTGFEQTFLKFYMGQKMSEIYR